MHASSLLEFSRANGHLEQIDYRTLGDDRRLLAYRHGRLWSLDYQTTLRVRKKPSTKTSSSMPQLQWVVGVILSHGSLA